MGGPSDYLKRLTEWQASSHPELAELTPERLFDSMFAETYRALHEDIWFRIVRLHGTLFAVEKLADFPFDWLYRPDGMEFWRLVFENFFDMSCVLLHGLVTDETADAHTIRRFKNQIMRASWRDGAKRELLRSTLAEREFDDGVTAVADRIRVIRHQRIAHRLIRRQKRAPNVRAGPVGLPELRTLFRATHALFGALSFGSSFVTLSGDMMPSTVGGVPTRSCLEGVLDAVLRDSDFVNEPERNAQWWPAIREHIDPERLRVMNECRKRVGLAEA